MSRCICPRACGRLSARVALCGSARAIKWGSILAGSRWPKAKGFRNFCCRSFRGLNKFGEVNLFRRDSSSFFQLVELIDRNLWKILDEPARPAHLDRIDLRRRAQPEVNAHVVVGMKLEPLRTSSTNTLPPAFTLIRAPIASRVDRKVCDCGGCVVEISAFDFGGYAPVRRNATQ